MSALVQTHDCLKRDALRGGVEPERAFHQSQTIIAPAPMLAELRSIREMQTTVVVLANL